MERKVLQLKSDERFVLSPEEAQMVEDNLDLVKWIVNNRISWNGQEDFQDKVQIGSIGLIKAVKTFDKSKKVKFATYASTCIMNEIRMDIRRNEGFSKAISLEQPLSTQNDDIIDLTIGDSVVDERNSNFTNGMDKQIEIARMLSIVLNCLKDRQRFIMLLSMAEVKKKEIGKWLGITKSRVCKITSECQKKLNAQFLEDGQKMSYREVFKVAMEETTIIISFSTSDVKNFNQSLASALREIQEPNRLTDFELKKSEEQVIIYLPAERDALEMLAILIKNIETFEVKCETNLVADKEQSIQTP